MTENQRALFEAWVCEHIGRNWIERADESAQGDRLTYCEMLTRRLYCAWQAALSTQATAPPPMQQVAWLVEHFSMPNGNSTGRYHTGFTTLGAESRATTDPYQAKRYTPHDADKVAKRLGSTLAGEWRAVEHIFCAPVTQMEEDTADLHGQLAVMKALLGEAANVIRSLTDEVESQAEADELRRLIDMISDARGRNHG